MDRMSKLDVLKGLAPDRPVIKDSTIPDIVDRLNKSDRTHGKTLEAVSELKSMVTDATNATKTGVSDG